MDELAPDRRAHLRGCPCPPRSLSVGRACTTRGGRLPVAPTECDAQTRSIPRAHTQPARVRSMHEPGKTRASMTRNPRPRPTRKRRPDDDDFMVVVVDGGHVSIPRAASRLRVGLSRVGPSLPPVCPATSRPAGSVRRRLRRRLRGRLRAQSSVLGMGRRLRLDGALRGRVLGCRGALVAVIDRSTCHARRFKGARPVGRTLSTGTPGSCRQRAHTLGPRPARRSALPHDCARAP